MHTENKLSWFLDYETANSLCMSLVVTTVILMHHAKVASSFSYSVTANSGLNSLPGLYTKYL